MPKNYSFGSQTQQKALCQRNREHPSSRYKKKSVFTFKPSILGKSLLH